MKIKLLFNFLTTRGYLHQLKSYKEIIVEAAKKTGLDENLFKEVEERNVSSFLY